MKQKKATLKKDIGSLNRIIIKRNTLKDQLPLQIAKLILQKSKNFTNLRKSSERLKEVKQLLQNEEKKQKDLEMEEQEWINQKWSIQNKIASITQELIFTQGRRKTLRFSVGTLRHGLSVLNEQKVKQKKNILRYERALSRKEEEFDQIYNLQKKRIEVIHKYEAFERARIIIEREYLAKGKFIQVQQECKIHKEQQMHKADEIFKEYGLEGYLILEKVHESNNNVNNLDQEEFYTLQEELKEIIKEQRENYQSNEENKEEENNEENDEENEEEEEEIQEIESQEEEQGGIYMRGSLNSSRKERQRIQPYLSQTDRENFLKQYKELIQNIEKQGQQYFEASLKYSQNLSKYNKFFQEIRTKFDKEFMVITRCVNRVFNTLSNGGELILSKINQNAYDLDGIIFSVRFPFSALTPIHLLSGGQKTIIGLAIILGLNIYKRSNFLLIDQADSHLDCQNAKSLSLYLKRELKVQKIVITHRTQTLENGEGFVLVEQMQEGGIKALHYNKENVMKGRLDSRLLKISSKARKQYYGEQKCDWNQKEDIQAKLEQLVRGIPSSKDESQKYEEDECRFNIGLSQSYELEEPLLDQRDQGLPDLQSEPLMNYRQKGILMREIKAEQKKAKSEMKAIKNQSIYIIEDSDDE